MPDMMSMTMPIPPNINGAAFNLVGFDDAFTRNTNPNLTGAGVVIGIMEEVNHFHPEFDVASNDKIHPDSIFTSPYPTTAPRPEEKFIIAEMNFAEYPNQACYLQFNIPCPDNEQKYFLRMADNSLHLIPGLNNSEITTANGMETSEFGSLHGTAVASLAAATINAEAYENQIPFYGIARNARILVYARPVQIAGLTSSPQEHADYFRNAPMAADVYNFSHVYGFTVTGPEQAATIRASPFSQLATAIRDNGKVIIAAAGNSGGDMETHPRFPAALPLFFPDLRGRMIATAAVGEDGRIAAYSNHCGSLPSDWDSDRDGVHYCLAAPGGGSETANALWVATAYTLQDDGTAIYHRASGTSFAAPMVAGAFALLKQQFSSLSDQELVLRLLQTANRTGIYNNPAIYGAGLLDLDAATRPVGEQNMQVGNFLGEASHNLGATRLAMSPAFGDGLPLALADTQFAAFDELGAPFRHPLASLTALPALAPSSALDFQRRGLRARETPPPLPLPNGGSAFLSSRSGNFSPWGGGYAMLALDAEHQAHLSLRQPFTADTELLFAAGDIAAATLTLSSDLNPAPNANTTAAQGNFPHPYLALFGSGLGFGGAVEAENSNERLTALGFVGSDSINSISGNSSSAPTGGSRAALLDYAHDFTALRLGLQTGVLMENSRALGLRGEGAFGDMKDSSTLFAGLALDSAPVASRWRFHTRLFGGLTRPQTPAGGLIDGWSHIASSAFHIGFGGDSALRDGDRIGFSLQQPLRVERGAADLRFPVGRTREAALLFERRADVPLTPSGRELRLAARYELPLGASLDFALDAGVTREGGHSARRPDEFHIFGDMRLRF